MDTTTKQDRQLILCGMLENSGTTQEHNNRVYDVEGIAPTATAVCGGTHHIKIFDPQKYRVRKLTPTEYGRLQAFPMNRWKQVVSDSEWRTTSNPIAGDMMYSVCRIIDTNDIDYSGNRESAMPYIYDENMCMKIAKTLNDENITDFDAATKRADELMEELTPIYRMLTDAIQDHRTIHFKNEPKEEVYVKDARDLNIRNETLVWGEDGYQLRGDTNKGEDMYLMNFGTNKYKIFEYIISHDMELDYIEAHTKTARELSEGDIVKLPPVTMVSTRGGYSYRS